MARRPALVVAILAVLAILSTAAPVAAQVDRSEQQRLEAEIATGQRTLEARRAEIDAITRELGATEATLRARIDERDRVSGQLRELELQRDDLQAGITTLRGEVADTEARVAALEADLEAVKVRVQGLLLNLHRQRAAGYGTNLARTESFHDLAVRSRFVGLMAAQDVAIVTELDALIGELDAARVQLAGQIAELEARPPTRSSSTTRASGSRA